MSVIVVLLAASKTFQHHSARVTRGCAIWEATEKLQPSTVFSVSQGRRPSCQDLPGERRGTDCGLSPLPPLKNTCGRALNKPTRCSFRNEGMRLGDQEFIYQR